LATRGGRASLSAGLADVGGLHGVWIDDFALADLAAIRDGSGGNPARDDLNEFLLLTNATGGPGVDGEEGAVHIHENGEAVFLGHGELSQERGVTLESGG